jgi:3-ketosteroid 9alpha-monooxygenase subunit B
MNGRQQSLKYYRGETLLETMRRAGLPAPFVCEQGVCGSCMVRRLQGDVALMENHVLSDRDLADGRSRARVCRQARFARSR